MTKKIAFLKPVFLSLFLISLAACSHGPAVQDFADSANPSDEAKSLEKDMNAAAADQVDVLAPDNFKQAQGSLSEAKKDLEHQSSSKDTLHAVAEGRAYLSQALDFAKLVHLNLEDVVIARQQAMAAGAPSLLPDEFKEADNRLRDITSDIEKNDLKSAEQNRSQLQASYLGLELKGIKNTHLKQPIEIISQAKKEGAQDFAPRSLALAEKSVKDTDAYIVANRHDTYQLKTLSGQTKASADHLLKITRDAKAGTKTSSEEAALQMESETNKVAAKQVELNQQTATTKALSIENENLSSEQAFNKNFELAQKQFTHSEAEVYKQGNSLIIRLRGLEFPVAQALLKGSSFPLLAKVEKVIQGFGKSAVMVEGHTDSNGGKVLNDKLSSDRAEAVKQYLISNAGQDQMTVSAQGYGYQKPLATNKTSEGRAQNRRVDVIIHPEKI